MSDKGSTHEIVEELSFFLEDTLSQLSPGLHIIIDVHVKRVLGKSLPRALVDEPRRVYDVLSEIMSESAIKVLESALVQMLRRIGVFVDPNLITNLKLNNNKAVIDAARRYVSQRRFTLTPRSSQQITSRKGNQGILYK